MLHITTFGRLQVCRDASSPLAIGNGKTAALFGYLLASARAHRREELAELFWPEAGADAARLNLRQLLFVLRRNLEPLQAQALIAATPTHVGIAADLPLSLDLRELGAQSRRAAATQQPGDAELVAMELAVARYHAPFLDELAFDGCPDFDDWLLQQRAEAQRQALRLLACIAQARTERGDHAAALRAAERAAEIEPCDETVQLRLVRMHLHAGRSDAALAQYERACAALLHEVGARPGEALRAAGDEARRNSSAQHLQRGNDHAQTAELRPLTTLSVRLPDIAPDADLEQAFERVRALTAACEHIVAAHGGHLVQLHGGSFMAYFGFPPAQERVTLQALRAAIALRQREPLLTQALHRGVVVKGSSWGLPDPLGTLSRATLEIRRTAAPGDIVLSAEARAQVEPIYGFVAVAARGLRAQDWRHAVWRLGGNRDAAAPARTPLVGRRAESAALQRAWHAAESGSVHAVLLRGEVGSGKTRLIAALRVRARIAPEHVVQVNFVPQDRNAPQLGIRTIVASLLGLDDATGARSPQARRHALRTLTSGQSGDPAPDAGLVALLERLLELPATEPQPAADPHPAADSLPAGPGRLLELLLWLLRRRSSHRPTLLVLEDMQWADDATSGLLEALLAQATSMPLLVLLSARPEWNADWSGLRHIELGALRDADIDAMLDALRVDPDPALRRRIIERAQGNPLFAEELSARDTGSARDGRLADFFAAGIDQLGDARATAQLAAALGRSFDPAVVRRASALAPDATERHLERLRALQILEPAAGGRLAFRHALACDAAYDSLGSAARRRVHRRIAETLESGDAELMQSRPDTLAQHWSAAGEPLRAASAWLAAARKAAAGGADALAQCERGLRLLDGVGQGAERDRIEFGLLLCIVRLSHKRSLGDYPHFLAHLARLLALAGRGDGDPAELFDALWASWESAGSLDGHRHALHLAEQLHALAALQPGSALQLCARYALGASSFWCGAFTAARDHLRYVLDRLQAEALQVLNPFGLDLESGAHAYLGLASWRLQQPRDAMHHARLAVALARARNNDFARCMAGTFAATIERWRDAPLRARTLARSALRVAQRSHAPTFAAVLHSLEAWADVREHADPTRLPALEEGVQRVRTSYPAALPMQYAMLADALRRLGHADRAAATLAEGSAFADHLDDRHEPLYDRAADPSQQGQQAA